MLQDPHHAQITQVAAPELTVVIPVYNEADSIESVVREWNAYLTELVGTFEIVIVNDGSTDGTGRIVDRLRKEHKTLRVLHQLNLGHDAAVRRGYEMAKGRFVVQIDGNGRYEPAEFGPMWERRAESRLVLGQRTRRLDGAAHRFLSAAMRRMLRLFFGINLQDPNAPFRLMQRQTMLSFLRFLPGALSAIDLVLTVLTAQEYPNEVTEIAVPHRLRTGLRHTRLMELFARASRYFSDLCAIRFKKVGIAPASPGLKTPTGAEA